MKTIIRFSHDIMTWPYSVKVCHLVKQYSSVSSQYFLGYFHRSLHYVPSWIQRTVNPWLHLDCSSVYLSTKPRVCAICLLIPATKTLIKQAFYLF